MKNVLWIVGFLGLAGGIVLALNALIVGLSVPNPNVTLG